MDPQHLKELLNVEQTYWWNVAKTELVQHLLGCWFPPPGRLVEGGIGGGSNLRAFQQMGYDVLGLDSCPESVEHTMSRDLSAQVHDLQQPWPVDPGSIRAIVLLDVLEHLPDPVMALKQTARLLEPGGGLVVTVPAYPALLGPWDEMLGHLRRYTKTSLMEQAAKAGLSPLWISYWNSFALPVAIGVRLKQRLFPRRHSAEFPRVPNSVNEGLKLLAKLERHLLSSISIPAGVSLVGVFKP
jgi:SAM-dependent methyltransferase